ncbi:MAG TPA: ATP-binding protein [Thermoanaerobaculia bacterium]|jgi:signal transduction histidine kinase/DNA-binding NarL/FixJ family response regulator|nr:ATP-binding protein [Thermoanaerobaculia bacterium]
MSIAIHPDEIEARRAERAYRLMVFELPLIRLLGSIILAFAVFLHNRYLLGQAALRPFIVVSIILFVYCALSWAALLAFYRPVLPRDLGLFFLFFDIVVWTFAIYFTGAERSWLFFIYLMRVADQVQTTVRRCLAFGLLSLLCYGAMFAWVVLVDGRPVAASEIAVRLLFIALATIYIALAARTAERRRVQMRDAIRMSRDSILQMEKQSAELREASARAEAASAAKSEFLTNMSHEMRTPLHAVLGMLQLARDGETSPGRARQIELARRSAESLLITIDDLLDFAKIEARKIDLETEFFSLRELLQNTMEPLDVSASSKGLTLSWEVDRHLPDTINTDPVRLRQILTNLIGNAIKFTSSGGIAVHVFSSRADEERVTIRFDVRDTGIGIDPAKQAAIFQPFTQADSSHSRRFGGSGLGLAIAARVIEAMGGQVEVVSQPGKGSTFSFTVVAGLQPGATPRRSARSSGRMPAITLPSRRMRVLVAEDHPVNQEFAAEALRRIGHDVSVASDGAEALKMMTRERFDVVLMDVQMPNLDGLEVTRRYRENEKHGRTRILALTAHTSREDRERCLESGMDEVLTKPLGLGQLAAFLGEPEPPPLSEALLAAVGGNVKLLARVSEAFSKQTPPLVEGMRTAITARDAIGLQRHVHTVKGAVSNFAGDPSIALARELEDAARADDFARAASVMPRLETALRELELRLSAAVR